MSGNAIEVVGLSKRYSVEEGVDSYRTLREALTPKRFRPDSPAARHLWALCDVDLKVAQGESVGVIGANGVGKTTLLKLIARISEPTHGWVRTRGRVGALLDVGTGFHPELTGQENIYLNGAVLGMRKSEIRRLFGAIVEFAGVERLLHTPVKHYSGGMYARLAFSVAAHLRAPILAVDEVLAVGDAQFRQKCLSRMSDLGDEGRTVLFVSHDLGPIRRLCERVIWLADGRLRMDGDPDDVIQSYLSNAAPATHFARPRSDHPAQHVDVMSVAVRQADEDGSSLLYRDRPLTITTRCRMAAGVPPIDVILSLRNAHGVLVLEEALGDQADLIDAADAEWEADVSMHVPPVLPAGDYVLGVRVSSYYEEYVMNADVLRFRLLPRHDDAQWSAERRRAVQPPVSWDIRPV